MKIAYINGYNGENSNKPKDLSKILNMTVDHIVYDYKENNIEEIKVLAKNYDLIIGSSTGAYIARDICFDLNIPLISLNPVIDLEKTFKELGVKTPNIAKHNFTKVLEEIIFLNEDDELIDFEKSLKLFSDKNAEIVIFDNGTHRFNNLVDIKEHTLDFIRRVYV